jgi:uncharacterized protein (DUF2141 family)
VQLANLTQVYDGSAKAVTVTTVPAGLKVNVTYDGQAAAPVSAGSYAVAAVVDEANYEGNASGTLTITPIVNVAGVVFRDTNGNGRRDEGETGLASVAVRLLDQGGTTALANALTDQDGAYAFVGVAVGAYLLEEEDPPGYVSTTANRRVISVPSGQEVNADFGDQEAGSLSGVVFVDLNGNGAQEADERGLAGVTITLRTGTLSQNTTTANDGAYSFSALPPGSYQVEETDPQGFTSTTPNVRAFTLSGGAATVNFGDQAVGTIAGVVFEDTNGNGVQDAGEPGLRDVRVTLSNGTTSQTAQTGADGAFAFTGLPPGAYVVEETDPPGFTSTTLNRKTLSLASGGSAAASFGDQAVGTIAGAVFNDADGNGQRGATEPGLGGVRVVLQGPAGTVSNLTAADGAFVFSGLVPGTYSVAETDPAGFLSTTPNELALSLGSGAAATANFGDQPVGTVSGLVFEDVNGNGQRDAGEAGLGGVSVNLTRGENRLTTRTAGDGSYLFNGLAAGNYEVEEIDPAGFISTSPNQRIVSLAVGGAATASFGDQATGTVSGAVFEDVNGNGTRDTGETGIGGVSISLTGASGMRSTQTVGDGSYAFAGVLPGLYTVSETDPAGLTSTTPNQRVVNLTSGGAATASFGDQAVGVISGTVYNDGNGNGRREAAEAGLAGVTITVAGESVTVSVQTVSDGAFSATGLPPGRYRVTETVPAGFSSTTPPEQIVNLSNGGAATASFGNQAAGVIAGLVFNDANGNGQLDPGEPGIGGVTVRLLGSGAPAPTLTTGDGSFSFPNVLPGSYTVEETNLPGFASTTPDQQMVSLGAGGAAAASFGDQAVQTIAGTVFEDLNGNGQQDAGEPGIAGVHVVLVRDADGLEVGQTVSAPNGFFLFSSVPVGAYTVREAVPEGYTITSAGPGPSHAVVKDANDAQGSGEVLLRPVRVEADGAASAGFANNVVGSISGMVFNDLNGNGAGEPGEPGIGGAAVELYSAPGGALVAGTVTTGTGGFQFAQVAPGTYEVRQTPLAGYWLPAPKVTVAVAIGGAATANFANRVAGALSGRVYHDENSDGQQNPTEAGLGGVYVSVVNDDTGQQLATATAGDGSYLFANLQPGRLRVQETDPTGFHSTTPGEVTLVLSAGTAASANFGDQSDLLQRPVITQEPVSQTVEAGTNVTLQVVAAGTLPLRYQWRWNGQNREGATEAVLVLTNVSVTNAGDYSVVVANRAGSVTSRVAQIVVHVPDPFVAWARQHNLPPGQDGPADDPDHDGIPNLILFAMNLDPAAPDNGARLQFELVAQGPNRFPALRFRRAKAAAYLDFRLLVSENLTAWAETPGALEVASSIDAATDSVRFKDLAPLATQPSRFYRLQVSQRGQ